MTKPWPGEFTDKNGKVVACIVASTENTKALEEFAERVNALRKKLADLLKPDNITLTLMNLSSNSLLPAPAAKEVTEEVSDEGA